METNQEIERKQRRGLVWNWLRFLRRIFTYETIRRPVSDKWRNIRGEEPPMVELEKLARKGLKEPSGRGRLDSINLERALNIMSSVAQADGAVTDAEHAIAARFIRDAGPEGLTEADKSRLLEIFRQTTYNYQQQRNEIFLLKKSISPQQVAPVVEALFELAYSGGIEHNESRDVSDIAERFGMPLPDIRLIAADVRRKLKSNQVIK
jgi:uncharacterized tellurite resistance protein B-like protein